MSEELNLDPIPLQYLFDSYNSDLSDYIPDDQVNDLLDHYDVETLSELEEIIKEADYVVEQRAAYSIYHLQSAMDLAREAARIESEYEKPGEREHGSFVMFKQQGSVINSITACTSFLESLINELLEEILDEGYFKPSDRDGPSNDGDGRRSIINIEEDNMKLLRDIINADKDSFYQNSFLKKYQFVLLLSNDERFDPGQQPYQDITTVRRLRNYFVHYNPEWITVPTEKQEQIEHRIGSALQGKFEENPLRITRGAYFPDRAIGYGCSEWCIESCLKFTDEFYKRLGVEPSYRHAGGISLNEFDPQN